MDFIQQRPMSNGRNGNTFDVKYKVLLLGDTLVGKTSLQRVIAGREFRPNIGSTIGVDFVNKIIPIEESKINLQIWDTAGQRNFRTIGRSYYASTQAFVLVYDVTNEETFYLIQEFNRLIEEAGLDTERRYLVANKIDLIETRKIDEETGRRFAFRNSMIYFETSCKTGENVEDVFEQIASDLVGQHNPEILESHRPLKDNFAFNYQTSSVLNHQIQDQNHEQVQQPKKKKRIFSALSSDSINRIGRFDIPQFIFCCNPRKSTATLD